MKKRGLGLNDVIVLAVFAMIIGATFFSPFDYGVLNWRLKGELTYEQAVEALTDLKAKTSWSVDYGQRAEPVALTQSESVEKILPSIDQYYLTVDPETAGDDVVVEVFVTSRLAWSSVIPGSKRSTQGLLAEIATTLNAENQRVSDGRRARVKIRSIPSGTAHQYISTNTYMPDAFVPVNHFWLRMLAARNIKLTPVRERLATTISGMVLKREKAKELEQGIGNLGVKAIINDVVQGNMSIGYTDPFHSSTGLNFLVTVLSAFAEGREEAMLLPSVVDTFEQFQKNVPFVALTTVEMLESVLKGGSLDAFVMDSQEFVSTEELKAGHQFVPYGIKNEYPLYGIGDLTEAKREVLELFARVAERAEFQLKSSEYGWKETLATGYQPEVNVPSGDILLQAQKAWKQKKDASRPISAVFLTDVSGSMDGAKLRSVREALVRGSEFIGTENSIGLVVFSNTVRVVQPIKRFDLLQRSRFIASAIDMQTSAGTAMYSGIVVGLSLLVEEMKKDPTRRPMLFVLTDGETNAGLSYNESEAVISGLKIPINTIGFEANLSELKKISGLVEAANINASESNVVYQIATLLNAKM